MRKITLTMITAPLAVIALAVGLIACGSTSTNVTDGARVAVGIGLEAYTSGYQPILGLYDKFPYCGDPAVPPCKDRALYRKLYEADAAAVSCSKAAVASLATEAPDFTMINECIHKVESAKLSFAAPLVSKGKTTP